MPRAIELNRRKTYGFLKPIAPTNKRKDGRVVWKFRCKRCGKITEKVAKEVSHGHTKSCGCLQREGAPDHLPTPAEQKRRYKQRLEITDEAGGKWRTLAGAAAYLRVSYQTILNYADDGLITQRPDKDGLGREVPYYGVVDMDAIKDAKKGQSLFPPVPGHMYKGDLAAKLGISTRTLNKKLKRMKAKTKTVPALGQDGQTRKRGYAPHWACEKLGVNVEKANSNGHDSNGRAASGGSPKRKSKSQVGRPKGKVDLDVAFRKKAMLDAWDEGLHGTNKAAYARAFEFHRPDASKWIKEHERAKRRKNPPR